MQLSEGLGPARTVQLAAELGVADLLGDGPRTAEDLAAATSTHPGALYRLLRALAGAGVFTEVEPGRFGLTPVGEHLRADHPQSLRAWVQFQGLFNGVYAGAMHSVRTGTATTPQVFGEPLFDHLDHHPEHAAVFQDAMAQHSRLMGAKLAAAYGFQGARQIVDVGGGDGSFLTGILRANPDVTGVVFDQPYVADAAHKQLAAAGFGDRCSFVSGDFLDEVPPGADVYMLKGVVHNWADDDAVVLLSNCRRAMGRDGRLLLIEWVVPTGDTPHPSKFLDLAMLFVYGGRERTEEEYVGLLGAAGLRLDRIADTKSTLNVIEVVPA
ncbi:methyltransferase [Pseudonocardia sp. K10HN5]|uniref:Methyltransferase n=1 Tax=Pseudonocardia acidicola TaxID=2724939 RepID=A0ABX1SEK7_9PSEU|nr:methyltransferase [Pseudonocardia acidicola]